jgi:aerotolerance regulator-like protein/VWA domain-containing protein
MSFLTPLFLLALAGLAVPVIIHLIQRERKNVVQFPSLMFLQRIPYQSVQRRRIRNWPLLLLRLAALALIVAAFARPFFRRAELAAAGAGGAREVVILIDNSYSMGYGDRWSRATAAARDAIEQVGPSDRATIVFFSSSGEVALKSTPDRSRLNAAVSTGKPGSGATRYGPALKLAGSIASESSLPNRQVIMVSDFQRSGWQGAEGVRLPDGVELIPRAITDSSTSNLSVTPVSLQRATFSEQDRVTVTGGVTNHSSAPASNVELSLEIDGRAVQTERVSIEPNSSASVSFAPFTPAARNTRGTVRIASDKLPLDNAFNFVVSPKQAIRIIIAERPGAPRETSLYLLRALALGETPPFDIVTRSIDSISTEDLQRASVVVLNDAPVAQLTAERLGAFVARGGGLLIAMGSRATWPAGTGAADILGATLGQPIDRTTGQAARLGALEYGDPIFEAFRAPRSGDFSGARFYSYRAVTPAKDGQVLARFDDGAPALVARRVGNGRVLLWTSSLDLQGNDLPLKAVFLPFVHRMVTTLASYTERPSWLTVGDVLEAGRAAPVPGAARQVQPRVVLTPSGERVMLDGEGPDVLELTEQGFYEVRAQGRDSAPPMTVASNVDLSESDLTPMDPEEVKAGVLGRAGGAVPPGTNVSTTDQEQEKNQRVWWYLLFAGIVILGLETLVGNRISRSGPIQV